MRSMQKLDFEELKGSAGAPSSKGALTPSKMSTDKAKAAPKSLYKNNAITKSHYVLKLAKENR